LGRWQRGRQVQRCGSVDRAGARVCDAGRVVMRARVVMAGAGGVIAGARHGAAALVVIR